MYTLYFHMIYDITPRPQEDMPEEPEAPPGRSGDTLTCYFVVYP